MSSLHARLAGLTLLLLLLWGVTSIQMRRRTADLLPTAEIAVEHEQPAGISLTRIKEGNGPVDIRNDTSELLFISLPERWVRDEVRGAALSSITGEEPSLGFRRWSVPAGAAVTFLQTGPWNKLLMRNVSDQPLRLKVITVDIAQKTSVTESTLVDDEVLLYFQ